MYIAIPSLVLLLTATASFQKSGRLTSLGIANGIIGLLGIALSVIMVLDPTWSFTRAWTLDEIFPVLRLVAWDDVWQISLIVLGIVAIGLAMFQRVVGTAVLGTLLIVVGLTFQLDVSWDYVWPLLVVALGVGLFFRQERRT
jgi:hypothetical protein